MGDICIVSYVSHVGIVLANFVLNCSVCSLMMFTKIIIVLFTLFVFEAPSS